MAMGLYIISWLVLAKLGADVIFGGYPNSLPARAAKQSI
jgi:hypothetical protein